MKKSLYVLFSLLLASLLFILGVHHLTEGFSLAKIQSKLPFSSEWSVQNPPDDLIKGYLSQDFFYLGKGSQCYVFESEDKQIVLKFFRHSRYRLPSMMRFFSFPSFVAAIQKQKKELKDQKLKTLFQSCKLAYEELNEESGILYLHLNQSEHLKRTVTLYDKLKRALPISIDDYTFIVQKQGVQIYPYLKRLLERGKRREAEEALASLTTLIAARATKGIQDHDAVIEKNSGFRGGKAFFMDIGSFYKESATDIHHEIWRNTRELSFWLQKNDGELAAYFDSLVLSYEPVPMDTL